MLTTKNRLGLRLAPALMLAGALVSCTPPGPKALLEGKRLLDENDPTKALLRLQVATSLMPTNAEAWNYFGLACHRTGQVTNALKAYQYALKLHPDLLEARFNLGCLWLEQNRPDQAKAAFTAYTLRQPNKTEGWLKLGLAHLQLRELTAAEKSYAEALRLSPRNAQAYNGLGLAALQRSRTREAVQFFNAAAQSQPAYPPALLNLAIVLHQSLRDKSHALQCYRAYLALTPKPANWDSVNAVARGLQEELARAVVLTTTNIAAVAQPLPEVPSRVVTNVPGTIAATKPELATSSTKPTPPVQAKPTPPPTRTVEVVPPLEIKTAQQTSPPATNVSPRPASTPPRTVEVAANPEPAQPEPTKRSFLQRLNPVNLFKRGPKTQPAATPLPGEGKQRPMPVESDVTVTAQTPVTVNNKPSPIVGPSPNKAIRRYAYHSPKSLAPGDRSKAEQVFGRGVTAQFEGKWSEAIAAYNAATAADPAYFEAYYNRGLAAARAGRVAESLAAYENALAINPNSADARYNFALELKQGGYYLDAANELERLVSGPSKDSRAHLALANLYAQQLRQPAKARLHYTELLELEPHHPQADLIRRWLVQNPG